MKFSNCDPLWEEGEFSEENEFNRGADCLILKQAGDSTPIVQMRRNAEISDATYNLCREKYAGPMPSEITIKGGSQGHRVTLRRANGATLTLGTLTCRL